MSFSQVFNNTLYLTQNLLKQSVTFCLKLTIAMFRRPMSASDYNKNTLFFLQFHFEDVTYYLKVKGKFMLSMVDYSIKKFWTETSLNICFNNI
jgi:hypothetical protein